jgi:hypothetical protein
MPLAIEETLSGISSWVSVSSVHGGFLHALPVKPVNTELHPLNA